MNILLNNVPRGPIETKRFASLGIDLNESLMSKATPLQTKSQATRARTYFD